MVFCSLCKNNKASLYNWQISDHGAEGQVNKYRICDDCANLLLKELTRGVMGIREGHEMPNPLVLSKTGVLDEILLHEDSSLEIVIDLDICKARRMMPKEIVEKQESG
jgi:hypothetical protein